MPETRQRNTARIPDVMVRCGQQPRVAFEVVSPFEMRDWRGRDRKRRDLQGVEGMQEIVEVYQDDYAVHIYRRSGEAWTFEALGGKDAVLRLDSLGIEMPLAEIYAFVTPPDAPLA